MITLKEYLEAVNFQITGGSEYQWDCYGDNARYLDSTDNESLGTYSINAIFDSVDQTVYAVELWDYVNNREYRWIHPNYKDRHNDEAKSRDIDIKESLDDRDYIEIEIPEDILEKINAVVNGKEYDTRIKVPLTLPDDSLFQLMKLAHEQDVTLNQFVENMLKDAIKNEKLLKDITVQKNGPAMITAKKKKKGKM